MTVDTIDANSPTVFDAGWRTGSSGRPGYRGRLRWGRTGSCQWRCPNRRTPTRTCRTARHPISKRATTF